MIKIIGLGPGDPAALTVGALDALKTNSNIYFRTEIHPTVDYIREKGIKFKTYDHFYESSKSFDEVYDNIARDLVNVYKETGELVYAVPGHPLVAERSVLNLIKLCKEEGIEYKIVPAVSFIDSMMDRLQIDPIEGLKVIDAFDIKNQILDKRVATIITQVYNPLIASEVKLRLTEYYNDETEVIYCRAAGIEGKESIRRIPLYELDMQEDIDYLTSVYIPKDLNNKKDIYDFIDLVDVLRGEDGCPWDREQTHESIKNAIIEESYEVADAIDNQDDEAIIEELGDVLLQIVFHASIGKEDGFYDFNDIVQGIYEKMVYRHPHVFKNVKVDGTEQVLQNWDELKRAEKSFSTVTDELEGVAKALPALVRANKIQKKAAKVGFDCNEVEEAMNKVIEELNEVKEVYKSENKAKITEEVGDLIFSCVNVARFLGVSSEEALNETTNKFIRRFNYIEKESTKNGAKIEELTLEQMDLLWEEAKNLEK